jgi:hypothetical protein
MIKYSFASNSDSATNKIAEFIKSFEPKIDFEIGESYFGKEINCKFENENDKDSFIRTLSNSLNISEDGTYLS